MRDFLSFKNDRKELIIIILYTHKYIYIYVYYKHMTIYDNFVL